MKTNGPRLIAALLLIIASSFTQASTPSFNAKLVRDFFKHIVEAPSVEDKTVYRYLANNYSQNVDGIHLDLRHFIEHMHAQKKSVKSLHVEFVHMIAEGDMVATMHLLHGFKKGGEPIEGQVNAFFKITDGKITSINELTTIMRQKAS